MNRKSMKTTIRKAGLVILACMFWVNTLAPLSPAETLALPVPGQMVALSPGFSPMVIKGMKIFPDNPLRFDFIVDTGGFVETQNLASLHILLKHIQRFVVKRWRW